MQKLATRFALVAALVFLSYTANADAGRAGTTDLGHAGTTTQNAGRSRLGSNRHQSTSDQTPRTELSLLQQTMLRTSYVNCTNETALMQSGVAIGGAVVGSFFGVVHAFFIAFLCFWGHVIGTSNSPKEWRKHTNQTELCAVLGLCSAVTMLAFYWAGYNCWGYNPIPLFGPGASVTPNELWELVCLAIAMSFIAIVLRLFAQHAEEPGSWTAAISFGLVTAVTYVFAGLIGLGNGVNSWYGSVAAVGAGVQAFQYFEGIYQVMKKYPNKRYMNWEFPCYIIYAVAGVGILVTFTCGPLVGNVGTPPVTVAYISDFYLAGYSIAAVVPFVLVLSFLIGHRNMRVPMMTATGNKLATSAAKRG
jgi:hypothetical protein